jgi:hypothetical protein
LCAWRDTRNLTGQFYLLISSSASSNIACLFCSCNGSRFLTNNTRTPPIYEFSFGNLHDFVMFAFL